MQIDTLIVGQGVSGTFLSHYLLQEGKKLMVIDNQQKDAPSRVAAGIINPVTGRRMVTVWMADTVLPFVWKAYNEIGQLLDITAISQRTIIDFFPNPFMRESFLSRIQESDQWLHTYPEQNHFNPFFNYEFGCGEIRPTYAAHIETLLPAWRARLLSEGNFREEEFEIGELVVSDDKVSYRDITATNVIFCDGTQGVSNKYFDLLPFAPNKGEALIVEIPGLDNKHIYKKSMTLAPLEGKDLFWIGSVYQWEFNDPGPTSVFKENTMKVLNEWIKVPFKVVDHKAGVRPATLERRPFVGMHPVKKNVGILNGMGTKGCSLSPYFAKQLTDHLVYHMDILPEANVSRFQRVLSSRF